MTIIASVLFFIIIPIVFIFTTWKLFGCWIAGLIALGVIFLLVGLILGDVFFESKTKDIYCNNDNGYLANVYFFNSDLPANTKLREKVVEEYTPKPLLDLVGLENILQRVPDNYLNAIISTKLATIFVYKYGLDSNEIDFYNYLQNYIQ